MSLILLSLIASIITLFLGYAWHGPILGRKFMIAMGMDPNNVNMSKEAMRAMYVRMAINVIIMIPMAFVTFMLVRIFGAQTFGQITMVMGVLFLGFLLPQTIIQNLWNARPTKDQVTLVLIAIGYNLVNVVLWAILYFWLG